MIPKKTPSKHTTDNDNRDSVITLFVYGTLKKGFPNHDRYCRNAIAIQPATVWGRLYDLGAYPALEVPKTSILAHGTADPRADAATQARLNAHMPQHAANTSPLGDWDRIHGELITLPDPAKNLPPIDRLEGFRPGLESFYLRELVWVCCLSAAQTAWLYTAGCVLSLPTPLRVTDFTPHPAETGILKFE